MVGRKVAVQPSPERQCEMSGMLIWLRNMHNVRVERKKMGESAWVLSIKSDFRNLVEANWRHLSILRASPRTICLLTMHNWLFNFRCELGAMANLNCAENSSDFSVIRYSIWIIRRYALVECYQRRPITEPPRAQFAAPWDLSIGRLDIIMAFFNVIWIKTCV